MRRDDERTLGGVTSGRGARAGSERRAHQTDGAAAEEILAPFDTAARFVFLVGSRLTPQLTVPAQLSSIRGLEIRLVGASVSSAQGESEPTRFALHPRVRFGNMLVP